MAYNGTKTIEYPSFLLRRYVKFSILVGDMSLKEVAMAFMKVKCGSLEGFCHLMGNSDETAIYAHFFSKRMRSAYTVVMYGSMTRW
jgi:hypothetical protein